MRILLDTCEFLWLVTGDAKLSASVATTVRDPQNQVFAPFRSGKSSSNTASANCHCHNRPRSLSRSNAKTTSSRRWLWMKLSLPQLSGLPALHRDPFDRMLVCQAQAHGLTLASSDSLVRQYPVALL